MRFIIGDVHGCLPLLDKLLLEIHKRDKSAEIFCVGDYCDRGPDSRGVVDRILKEGIQGVRGNHDDMMDCILSGKPTECSDDQTFEAPLSSLYWFRSFGMFETFASYGQDRDAVKAANQSINALKSFVSCVPQEHHEFYHKLPFLIERDDFFIAHAAMPPELALTDALTATVYKKALIWGRYTAEQVAQKKVWGKTGYFGHTPTKHYGCRGEVVYGPQVMLIDTGAVFGDGLTAVCHETKEVIHCE